MPSLSRTASASPVAKFAALAPRKKLASMDFSAVRLASTRRAYLDRNAAAGGHKAHNRWFFVADSHGAAAQARDLSAQQTRQVALQIYVGVQYSEPALSLLLGSSFERWKRRVWEEQRALRWPHEPHQSANASSQLEDDFLMN